MPHSASEKSRIALHILATSDVHGALRSGESNTPPTGGLSRIATLVDGIRKTTPNSLLLDNGDFLQGTPICDLVAEGAIPLAGGHPVISAMNQLGYDAVGLGNHEFDYGLSFLHDTLRHAGFPVIGSNVSCPAQPWCNHIILERLLNDGGGGGEHIVKIGVLSVMPEQVIAWNASHLKGQLTTQDITDAARQTAKILRQAGAQIVIGLVHSGIGGVTAEARQENAAIPIAQTAEIDAMICGHTHQVLPDAGRAPTDHVDYANGQICGVPAAMPGFDGAYLAQITLQMELQGDHLNIVAAESKLLPATPHADTDNPGEDLALVRLAREAEAACIDLLNEPVGRLQLPIHSYFSRLPGDPAVALVAQAQLEFAKRNWAEYLPSDVPLISTASPFKGGGRGGPNNFACVPPGHVTRQDLTSLHPFQNTLVALEITGAQLKEWLEMSASNFNQIRPGTQDGQLRDTGFPCYGFDTVFGVTYAIDLAQPAKYNVLGKVVSEGHRIRDLSWQETPVAADQRFILLTTSYRAGGGGNFPEAHALRQIDIPAMDSRKILAGFVAKGIGSADLPKSPWRFTQIPDARACTLIGPGVLPFFAQGHRPEIEITAGSVDEKGFIPFSVNLGP